MLNTNIVNSCVSPANCSSIKSYMFAMQEFKMVMYIQTISYLFLPLLCYLLTWNLRMQVVGLMVSKILCDLSCAAYCIYTIRSNKKIYGDTWVPYFSSSNYFPFLTKAFKGWISYLRIAFPIGSTVYLEWLYFEIIAFIVSLLRSEVELAAYTSYWNIQFLFFMTAYGNTVRSSLALCITLRGHSNLRTSRASCGEPP